VRGGRLLRTYSSGTEPKLNAYLEDYAYLADALVSLYEATFEPRWVEAALNLVNVMIDQFWDEEGGGFYFTGRDHEQLIARNKDLHDASVPSGNAMAATALLRLGRLCGRTDYLDSAGRTLVIAASIMERAPTGAGQMLVALDMWLRPASELVLIGGSDESANQRAIAALQQSYLPNCVTAYRGGPAERTKQPRSAALEPLFAGRDAKDEPALYVCQNFACQAPVRGVEPIKAAIKAL